MNLTNDITLNPGLYIKAQYRLYMAQNSLQEVKECVEEASEMIDNSSKVFYKLKASIVLIDNLLTQIQEVL